MTIDELIDRVTAATKPGRELDDEIATVVWGEPQLIGSSGSMRSLMWHRGGSVYYSVSPEFTRSVDISMPIVPEGWTITSIGQDRNKLWYVSLYCGSRTSDSKAIQGGPSPTPALALCIAILKARRATESSKAGV